MPALHTLLPALLLGSMLALLAGQAPAQTGAATHTGPDTALQGSSAKSKPIVSTPHSIEPKRC
ncbi:hypothetical protein [Azoarcus sp. DD4]|uniref:hypothetical protein n=1 Tax=Azoarcus sp. DD4 TaxID=2027405 RepID=UPI001F0F6C69|nr:hypothetical protein [Azoarcus sp. DD4]